MYEVVGWGGRWKGLGDGWMDGCKYIYIYDFSNVESLYVIIILISNSILIINITL